MGTVGYMAPEQVRGKATDHRSDIFAFGSILYEMLSGKRAFRGETAADTMSAILKEEPEELSETGTEYSGASGEDCPALPGEESFAALPVGGRCSVQSGRVGG